MCFQDRPVKLSQLSTGAFTKIFTQHTSNARPNASRCCFCLRWLRRILICWNMWLLDCSGYIKGLCLSNLLGHTYLIAYTIGKYLKLNELSEARILKNENRQCYRKVCKVNCFTQYLCDWKCMCVCTNPTIISHLMQIHTEACREYFLRVWLMRLISVHPKAVLAWNGFSV